MYQKGINAVQNHALGYDPKRFEWFSLNIALVPFLRVGLEDSHPIYRTKNLKHRNSHMILNSVDDPLMTSRKLETPFRTGTYYLRNKLCLQFQENVHF